MFGDVGEAFGIILENLRKSSESGRKSSESRQKHRYCWRAVARQPTILYNSEIWPKSVGCKIVDLRSRMRSLYPGACGLGDMRSRFRATTVIKVSCYF